MRACQPFAHCNGILPAALALWQVLGLSAQLLLAIRYNYDALWAHYLHGMVWEGLLPLPGTMTPLDERPAAAAASWSVEALLTAATAMAPTCQQQLVWHLAGHGSGGMLLQAAADLRSRWMAHRHECFASTTIGRNMIAAVVQLRAEVAVMASSGMGTRGDTGACGMEWSPGEEDVVALASNTAAAFVRPRLADSVDRARGTNNLETTFSMLVRLVGYKAPQEIVAVLLDKVEWLTEMRLCPFELRGWQFLDGSFRSRSYEVQCLSWHSGEADSKDSAKAQADARELHKLNARVAGGLRCLTVRQYHRIGAQRHAEAAAGAMEE